ncbi:MAG TPA: hypothetical protein VMG12_35145, partial [Polyangiaceae bacterium]|nr:hypothetical protein [Polyangiaceae bacterium]
QAWREQQLAIDGDVSASTWLGTRDAGAILAVAFERNGDDVLGGVQLAPPAAAPFGLASAAPELVYLNPALASVRSELVGFGADRVAFLTNDPVFAGGQLFQSARFEAGAASVLAARERYEFIGRVDFWPSAHGMFAIDPSLRQAHFFLGDGASEVSHNDVLIAPSGAYTARVEGGTLRVYRAEDGSASAGAPAWAEAEGCSALLAWARGRERIACAVSAGASPSAGGADGAVDDDTQRVVFFDLDAEQQRLVELGRVQGDYRFLREQHVGESRLFADGGGRFAFGTDDAIYVVSLDDGAPHIEVDTPASLLSGRPLQLSFSARGGFLAAHAGDGLGVWNLHAEREPFARVGPLLPVPAGCSEDFLRSPTTWCGDGMRDGVMRWSSDEDLIAFRTAAGRLAIEDLSLDFPRGGRVIAVDDACAEGCIVPGAYQFQR